MTTAHTAILILAAGKGTRMHSKRSKILHDVGGKPMVQHVVDAARGLTGVKPVLVVSPDSDDIRALFGDTVDYVVQPEPLGTGHAVQVAADALRDRARTVLVTYADMPLLQPTTMQALVEAQAARGAAVSLLAVRGEPSSTFGRIVRDADGRVLEILEVANARRRPDPDRWLNIRELNAGVYCFDATFLWGRIGRLPLRQARRGHEYYLTDMIEMAVVAGLTVEAIVADDADECLGAGTRAELVAVERALRDRVRRRWLDAGVTLVDPATTYIDADVVIGQDTVIWPNSFLQGNTTIGEDCIVGPNTTLRDATLGRGCVAEHVFVAGATVPKGTHLPPFAAWREEKER